MESHNLKINVSDTIYIGEKRAKSVALVCSPWVSNNLVIERVEVWAPALARSPSVYAPIKFNLEAAL